MTSKTEKNHKANKLRGWCFAGQLDPRCSGWLPLGKGGHIINRVTEFQTIYNNIIQPQEKICQGKQ